MASLVFQGLADSISGFRKAAVKHSHEFFLHLRWSYMTLTLKHLWIRHIGLIQEGLPTQNDVITVIIDLALLVIGLVGVTISS